MGEANPCLMNGGSDDQSLSLERDYAKANFCSGETGRSLRYKRGQWMLVCNDSSEHRL